MPTTAAVAPDVRRLLLRIVEEAYEKPTWNGTNLRGTLRRVTADAAAWKPRHGRRSIAEIVLHCAYWKYTLRRRLLGEKRGSFVLEGSNWFEVPASLTKEQWAGYVELIDEEHRALCSALRRSGEKIDYSSASARTLVRKVFGLAMHDAYHTGQVHMLLAMHERSVKA